MTPELARAVRYIPDGSCTLSKRPAAWPSRGPRFASYGDGPYVVADNGLRYLDWLCALGALTVGHNHPLVIDALVKQVYTGTLFSLPSRLEAEVAERLCGLIPCAEQVKFLKTGSEACAAAVRVARLATGRELILTTETSYHGWHDGMIVAKPRHPGVPEGLSAFIGTFRYNDFESLKAWSSKGRSVAAIILEPVQGEIPRDDFLHAVIAWAHHYGALVIFDEMLCGGRLALAGAQQFYHLVPDLAVFGKAFGGGLPLAFVCGKRELMQHAWPVSGTFSGDALALAACDAMLDIYRDEDVINRLWMNGGRLLLALAKAAIPLVIHGQPPRFWVDVLPPLNRRLVMSIVVQQCATAGVLVHPAVFFANAAMTEEEVALSCDAILGAFDYVADGIAKGDLESRLIGEMYEDSVR